VTDKTVLRVQVANLTAHIVANEPTVTDWAHRYFGSWWQAEPTAELRNRADVQVYANVDADRYREVTEVVNKFGYETISYARKDLYIAHTGPALVAYSADQVAYTIADGQIVIVGLDAGRVASASCRLAREALRGALARDGWVLLHASAAVDDDRAYLAFGRKAAGKTSTVVQIAQTNGWAVLANDRVFARPSADGDVEVLPWPAAAAIGLGLLDAAGWYSAVADARDKLHSSTTATVLKALAQGSREPLRDAEREHKAQLFPDQITSLLGLPLATNGRVAAVLLPTITPDAVPAVEPGGREVGMDDVFHSDIEDRYPNVFKLREPEPVSARNAVFRALNSLPRATVILGHDIVANAAALTSLLQ
jgi:Isopentenyl transferase